MSQSLGKTSDGSASGTVAIAAGGNVVFTVGPDGRRLRVFSLLVKTVLPVLNAMLGANFKEGHQLMQQDESDILLPEDDAEALEIIFTTVHGRNDRVPRRLSPELLLRIATAGDKYCCLTARGSDDK